MRAAIVTLVLAVAASASAQPGADPQPPPDPAPYPPPPQNYPAPLPPPAPMPQPAPVYAQPIAVQLTAEEHELLQKGEISDGAHIGGGVANIFLGFGIGQAIQGRWGDRGWIFTLGQSLAVAGIIIGITESFDGNSGDAPVLFIGSYLAFLGLHIWGAVDAFVAPPQHNRKVRELRMRLGMPMPYYTRVLPYVKPTHDGGGTAGLVFRF